MTTTSTSNAVASAPTSTQDDATNNNSNEEASLTSSTNTVNATIRLKPPTNENTDERLKQIDELKYFLGTATNDWDPTRQVHAFPLPTGESLSCVFWNDLFHVTGTDIVRCLLYRFHLFGRPVTNLKKFEEGIFSDLRNLKPGMDASLEEPKSEFLEMLYKNNCIRTQKKQKVFFWFSVPHDRLFLDALERDLKREKMGHEPTSVAIAEPATSLSLDTTQELFDQLRKSMSLSAVAATHAMDENLNEMHHLSTNESNTTTTTSTPIISHALTATADDHDPPISASPILPHDLDWPYLKSPTASVRREDKLGHRSTRSLSSIHISDLPPTPPLPAKLPPVVSLQSTSYSADASPRLSPAITALKYENSETQQKIFGAFSLFEGSPTYKQRQRRRTFSSFTPVAIYGDGYHSPSPLDTNNLEIATLNAGLAINPHNLFTILRKHQQQQQQQQQLEGNGCHDPMLHEKVYTCPLPQCARLFKRLEHLKRHFRTHTLERPYCCTMCGKHFSRTDNLAQHKKTHNRGRSSVVVSRPSSIKSNHSINHNKSSPVLRKSTISAAVSESQQQLIIEKLSVLTSNDAPVMPTVDYFQGGNPTEASLKGEPSLYTSPTQSIQQDVVYGNFVSGVGSGPNIEDMMFPAPPTFEDGDFCMTEKTNQCSMSDMTSAMMYDKVSYDGHSNSPFMPPTSSCGSISSLWQSSNSSDTSTMHGVAPTSSSSSSLFNVPYEPLAYYETPCTLDFNSNRNQKEHHRLSWYSSFSDIDLSLSPMNLTNNHNYASNTMQPQLQQQQQQQQERQVYSCRV